MTRIRNPIPSRPILCFIRAIRVIRGSSPLPLRGLGCTADFRVGVSITPVLPKSKTTDNADDADTKADSKSPILCFIRAIRAIRGSSRLPP